MVEIRQNSEKIWWLVYRHDAKTQFHIGLIEERLSLIGRANESLE